MDQNQSDQNNANAEMIRAELLHKMGDGTPIAANFLRNVRLGGRPEEVSGSLIAEVTFALATLERRLDGAGDL